MPDKPFRVPHNRSTTGSCKPPVPFSPHLGMHCLFRLWSCLPRVPVPLWPVPLWPVPRWPVPLWGVSQIPHRETPLPNWIKMHNGASRLLGSGFQDKCRPKRIRISCEPTVDIGSLTSYTYRPIRWPLGEIGRHARLRILCREASGFDSPSGHCKVLPGVQSSQYDSLATAGRFPSLILSACFVGRPRGASECSKTSSPVPAILV